MDPFAGGGAIPLEAQRLGLEAHAHDLNPVAVIINKAMIEIPPRFAGKAPINPDAQTSVMQDTWERAQGLAEDVRYYGEWMKKEAYRRIGHLYPKVKVPHEQGGGEAVLLYCLRKKEKRHGQSQFLMDVEFDLKYRIASAQRSMLVIRLDEGQLLNALVAVR